MIHVMTLEASVFQSRAVGEIISSSSKLKSRLTQTVRDVYSHGEI